LSLDHLPENRSVTAALVLTVTTDRNGGPSSERGKQIDGVARCRLRKLALVCVRESGPHRGLVEAAAIGSPQQRGARRDEREPDVEVAVTRPAGSRHTTRRMTGRTDAQPFTARPRCADLKGAKRGCFSHNAIVISERFEQLIAFLESNLPKPVDQQPDDQGGIIFSGGSPVEVVAHLTATSVTVSEYAGVWETPYIFTVKPRRVGLVKWRRLPETPLINALSQLIQGARAMRLSTYLTCRSCEQVKAPEFMIADLCADCAARDSRVVH